MWEHPPHLCNVACCGRFCREHQAPLPFLGQFLVGLETGNISQTPCWVPMTIPQVLQLPARTPSGHYRPCRVLGTQGSQERGGFLLQGPYCAAHAAGFASFPSIFSKLQRDGLTEAYCVVGHQPFQCLWESDGKSSAQTCRSRLSHLGTLGISGWPSI